MSATEVIPYAERIGALSIVDVRAQVNLIQHIMKEVMQGPSKEVPEGVHYGVIPGTPKPTLYKAGAEKLCLTFRLDPQYEIEQKQDGKHLTVMSKCTLWHIPSGQRYGSGMGSCSTMESKYAYRTSKRKCPKCGAEAIIKGKEEYGGGWLCFKKNGGCGAKFGDDDETITSQVTGRVPNEDVADQYNTVLKMANKRSLIAAVLNTTAASDIFTQDIEDMPGTPAHDRTAGSEPPTGQTSSAASAASAPTDGETREQTLRRLCKDAGANMIDLLAKAKVTHADELSEDDWASAMRYLKKKAASVRAAA